VGALGDRGGSKHNFDKIPGRQNQRLVLQEELKLYENEKIDNSSQLNPNQMPRHGQENPISE